MDDLALIDDLEEAIRNIEGRSGVRAGFFADLLKEDDWSFIIKAHALLESACAELLAERTGVPALIDVFSRLELSAKTTGKVAFLKAFDLAIDRERRFIVALSELRNTLVHNVRNTTFSLTEHVLAFDRNQKKSFVESFGYAYLSEDENGKEFISQPARVLEKPKESIWLGLKYVLGVVSIQMDRIRLERDIGTYRAKIGEQLLPNPSSRKKEV
jgi:hypothetical protein